MVNQEHVLDTFLATEQNSFLFENLSISKKKIKELERFFAEGGKFEFFGRFDNHENYYCGFALFNTFAPFVSNQTKEYFLKTVWDMFADYPCKYNDYWHPWHGSFSPGGGALFAEGFLKYEIYLAEDEPYFDNIRNYDSDWFDTTTAFLAAVKQFSSQSTYGLFIYQFANHLAGITKKETPSLSSIKALTRKEDQKTIINLLASLANLSTQDFEKIALSWIPDGDIIVCE